MAGPVRLKPDPRRASPGGLETRPYGTGGGDGRPGCPGAETAPLRERPTGVQRSIVITHTLVGATRRVAPTGLAALGHADDEGADSSLALGMTRGEGGRGQGLSTRAAWQYDL